ncbi:MAG: PAS domain-containing protein [Labilithrix sp.]|nr:PAS domain-containing protein [Labilithrix sp.]
MINGPESIDDAGPRAGERDEHELGALLDFLHRDRGFDFSGHKRPSLARRVRRRMVAVGADSVADYIVHLERSPDELAQLFNLLLINVTSFFRDPAAWQALAGRLPAIVGPHADTPIRVWSAGCSSGEEPYTLAMVLCEALGEDVFSRRVKIYATDIDEEALALARLATYSPAALESVPAPLVERYFTPSGSDFVFRKDLRRDVVFGRHDLLTDAPIPRVDVLVCRNLLMYFNAETQERLLERLQFASNPGGVLFLGKAEMLLSHGKIFSPVDLKLRLFTRVPPSVDARAPADGGAARASRQRSASRREDGAPSRDPADAARERLRAMFSESAPIAQIVVDAAGCLVGASQKAAQLFSIGPRDVGRSLEDLALASRPADVHAGFERARLERRPVQLKDVERVLASGDKAFLDVDVTPVIAGPLGVAGAQITFVDVTHSRRLRSELRRANLELEAAHEELRATRLELRGLNEELQSTNEELETMNEELKATNEELETMNEELQSTNEELQTINEELRQRGTELNQTHALFDAVLASLHVGIAVLDRELRVFTWNAKMTELLGVRPRDAEGKHFASLEGALPLREIAASLRAALEAREESRRTLDGKSARGDALKLEVRVSPLRGEGMRGVIVLVGEVG